MAQAKEPFTAPEKNTIVDALSQLMQVTARAARAAQDKGLSDVATAYHKTNAETLRIKSKVIADL